MDYLNTVECFNVNWLYIHEINKIILEFINPFLESYKNFQQCMEDISDEIMTDVGEDDLSYCLGWCYELNPYGKYTDEFERFIDDVLELEKECFEFIEGTRDEVHKKLLQDKMHDILEKSTSIGKIEKIKDEIEKDDQLLEDKHIDRLYDAIKQVSSFFEKEQYLVNVNNLVDKCSQIFHNSFNFENQYIEDYYIWRVSN